MRIPSSTRSDTCADPVSASTVHKAPFLVESSNRRPRLSKESGSLMTSFLNATGVGVATVFCIYGVWQIWHFIMYPR